VDRQRSGPQTVTVENSMSVVHRTQGQLPPASQMLRSEVAIVAGVALATMGDLPRVQWQSLVDDYALIRDLIEAVVPGFQDFNTRVQHADGFVLPNTARERQWVTATSKATFTRVPLPQLQVEAGQLILMTIRSHDQFRFQITLRAHKARPLTSHVQAVLRRTTLPEDVTVVFDIDAYNFS
jgi:hypothetical protein